MLFLQVQLLMWPYYILHSKVSLQHSSQWTVCCLLVSARSCGPWGSCLLACWSGKISVLAFVLAPWCDSIWYGCREVPVPGPEQRRPKPSSACSSGRVKEGREVFALSSINYTFLIEVLLYKVKCTDELWQTYVYITITNTPQSRYRISITPHISLTLHPIQSTLRQLLLFWLLSL